jgi:hypothetical protein
VVAIIFRATATQQSKEAAKNRNSNAPAGVEGIEAS